MDKKIRILVIPSDKYGCGKFRSVDPHVYIAEHYKDEFDVEIVGYEQDFGEWRDKSGKPHNVTYWMPLPEPPVKY